MMDLDLDNKQILRLAASIPRVGRLAAPDASAPPVRGLRLKPLSVGFDQEVRA